MSDFERGLKEGYTEARLDEHANHLATINGSIEHTAAALDDLVEEVRQLRSLFELQTKVAEAGRLALEKDTEARRQAMNDEAIARNNKFTKREKVVTGSLASLVSLLTVYFKSKGIL